MYDDLWYKNAVIYCLSVETFLDGNGDGVGDFQGLTRSIDYLHGMGVTAIWLMPFHPSPGRDDGYDVTDYYGIDPRFGTLGDFAEFAERAHQRGLRILMDLVVNHTSDQHPWFQAARSDPKSPYRDWYVWSKKRPRDAEKGIVFPGVQETTWTRDDAAGEFYFHRFYEHQPDLNTSNPHVQAEILKIMGFWLKLGVSGFRLDAAPFLISHDVLHMQDAEPQFDMLRLFREFAQWRTGDSVFLAEANVAPAETTDYFGADGERLQMMFNFHLNQNLFLAMAKGEAAPLVASIAETRTKPRTAQWALHLRNHDELDLGRLDDDDRETVFAAFGPEPEHQLYHRGIRRRLAPMLGDDRRRLELAYSLLLTLPGTPVLRYGDEIGMGDDLSLPERHAARTPMQWSPDPHGGFTRSDTPVMPVIDDGPYGFRLRNAAAQRRDPQSLLNWTERMVRMRAEVPEIGWGEPSVVEVDNPAVFALRYDWRGVGVLFLHNLAGEPHEIRFDLGDGDLPLTNLLSEESSTPKDGRFCLTLEGYGYRWFRLGGLDHLLLRREL